MYLKELLQQLCDNPSYDLTLIVMDALKEESLIPMEWVYDQCVGISVKREGMKWYLRVSTREDDRLIAKVSVEPELNYHLVRVFYVGRHSYNGEQTFGWAGVKSIKINTILKSY